MNAKIRTTFTGKMNGTGPQRGKNKINQSIRIPNLLQ